MDEDKYRPLSNPHGNTNSDTTEDTTSIESEDLGEIQSGYSKSMNVDDQDGEDRSGKLKIVQPLLSPPFTSLPTPSIPARPMPPSTPCYFNFLPHHPLFGLLATLDMAEE
ncbi:hypothetical protein Ancab_012860 [Ancistrocladus abbreviatus]